MNNETQSPRPFSDDEAYRQYVEANQTQEDLDQAVADGRVIEHQVEKTYETMSRAELADVIGRAEAIGDVSTSNEAQHFLEEKIEAALKNVSDELPEYEDLNGNIVHGTETPRQRYRRMLTDKYLNEAIGIKENLDANELDAAPEKFAEEHEQQDLAGLAAEDATAVRAENEHLKAQVAELKALVEAKAESKDVSAETEPSQFIDRSSESVRSLEDDGVLPALNQRRENGSFASGKEEEYVTAEQLEAIEANAETIKAGLKENLALQKDYLAEKLDDEEALAAQAAEEGKKLSELKRSLAFKLRRVEKELGALDAQEVETDEEVAADNEVVAEDAEVAAEKKELAEKQPRAVRKETNGPTERLVLYKDGSFEWVPVDEQKAEEVDGEGATAAAETSETNDDATEAVETPAEKSDTDKARELAGDYDLDDPVQMGKYRAKLESEGISTAGLDAEALKKIASGEETFASDEEKDDKKSEQDDTTKSVRELAEGYDLEDPVQMGKYRAKLEKEGISTAGLDAEALKRIAAGEEDFPSKPVEARTDAAEGSLEGSSSDDKGEEDESSQEKKKKDIEAYDRGRLENLLKLRDEMRAESEKLRAEGKADEADVIDSKIVEYNLVIKDLEEKVKGYDTESEGEKPDNPTLDGLPAREDEASKERSEKEKALADAANKLAELKAQPWFRKDKEAIKAAEAEYLGLAQEAGREIVDGYEDDEETRQSLFAATQVAMWEDINTRVAELKKETKYGKFTEAFGKLHPAARMAIMAGAGVGIGVAAAAVGTVTGGIGGAAVIAGATTWAAKLAKAKVSVDISGSDANKERERGKFDALMAGASRVTGLAKLTKWGEGRLDRRFESKEAQAVDAISSEAQENGWTQDDIDAEVAKRKAELTEEKNRARSRRAMATSAVFLVGGGAASFLAAETLGMPSLEDHINSKSGDQTSLDEVPARTEADTDATDTDAETDSTEADTDGAEVDPLPGEYTADNIYVNYEEYLSENKISDWAMGEHMDMTSTETAMDDMWDLGESDPGHAGQMVQGYLTDAQKEELGLGGMTPQQVENALHDDATRAAALNMIAEELENGGAKVEIVDNVSGNFYNWGAAPVDENGNIISMEEARANGITDTELVQSERYLSNVSLLRVTDANGNVSYFNSECKNFLTEQPTPHIPVESDPTAENPSDYAAENPSDQAEENPSDHDEENPGTAPDDEAENPGTSPEDEEENPGTAPEDEAENPGTSPDGE
ncbi:MAG TPA: hypothetical protein PKD28_02265, partial [Candidatus Saccharibacteria bacterium]|nr:hypothetical protein [Candidatus Saccharibacteria bacterium]